MPTYEYSCKRCGETMEVFQSFSDKPLRTHRDCGGELKKVFHSRGVVFKGSGFYRTDSRSASAASTTDSSDTATKSKSTKSEPSKPDSSSTVTASAD